MARGDRAADDGGGHDEERGDRRDLDNAQHCGRPEAARTRQMVDGLIARYFREQLKNPSFKSE
jgi:hypothetical protein